MSIWLSQIELDPRDRVMRAAVGDAHALHRLVVRAVSADTPAGVPARSNASALHHYIPATAGENGRLLMQSAVKPDWSFLPSQGRNVAVKDISPFWDSITTGTTYLFRLTAAPEHLEINTHGRRCRGRRAIREPQEQISWLSRRLANAATLVEVTVAEGPRVHGEREGKRIDFTPVTFAGVLAATDSAALRAIAVTGIGPRKAFGMGLLSIRKLPTTP